MNLTDLQMELRNIEEHISTLHEEIEKMKPKTEEEKKTDFDEINKLAEKSPIVNRSINEAPSEIKKTIFSSLSYILLLEETDFYNRTLYLCRLAKGSDFNISAEEIYKLGLEFEMADINKLCQDISEYKYTYLVEALIIANFSEEASVNMLSIIADIAEILNVEKEELRVLGMTAKAVLINDMDYILEMPVPSKNMWSGKLREYLSEEWIESKRQYCEILCTSKSIENPQYIELDLSLFPRLARHTEKEVEKYKKKYIEMSPCMIKKRLKAGSVVRKGDEICSYVEKEKKKSQESNGFSTFLTAYNSVGNTSEPEYISNNKTLIAPCDGIVYFVNKEKKGLNKEELDKYISVYVVSYFDDYENFKNWYKNKSENSNK